MASLTIRNLEDDTKRQLRLRAAMRGASMEEEARSILRAVVDAKLSLQEIAARKPNPQLESAWEGVLRLREKYGTFEVQLPERTDIAGDRNIFDR